METKILPERHDALAPDGSEVRVLAALARGSMAHFSLAPGQVARAVRHRSVDELWYVLSGRGRIWRSFGGHEEVTPLTAGVSLAIQAGAAFQFRAEADGPLCILGVTMPPWPGADEAVAVDGVWKATE